MAVVQGGGDDGCSCLGRLISQYANGVMVSPEDACGSLFVTTNNEDIIGTVHKLGDRLIIQQVSVDNYSSSYPPEFRDYEMVGSPLSINIKEVGAIRVIFGEFRDATITGFIRQKHQKLGSAIKLFSDERFGEKIVELLETLNYIKVLSAHPFPSPLVLFE